MAESTQSTDTGADQGTDSVLPVSPFRSLNPHFGMLMGVDDFQLLQSYSRGKLWLHNAWLHGAGAVWGLAVSVDEDGRLLVSSGLALDPLGRELYLPAAACLDLAAWLGENRDAPRLTEHLKINEDGSVAFDAHVVIAHRACLERQVPALREPCEGDSGTTAYSRVSETVELRLDPGPFQAPAGEAAFRRLRVLFALEPPEASETELIEALGAVEAVSEEQRPAERLVQMRRLAALDSAELGPPDSELDAASGPFPATEAAALPLANLEGVQLDPDGDGWRFTGVDSVDLTIRPVILPTPLIQELLCGPVCSGPTPAEDMEFAAAAAKDAGGPRILAETVSLEGRELKMRADRPVSGRSVSPESVRVLSYKNNEGWIPAPVCDCDYADSIREISVKLEKPPEGNLVRIIVKGTGETPVVGTDEVPLAGPVGGPASGGDDGRDFVHMFKKRS